MMGTRIAKGDVIEHVLLTFYEVTGARCEILSYISNKSPTRCNNFPVYYPDVYLQLNMFFGRFPTHHQ
jgi:hypothetical protein